MLTRTTDDDKSRERTFMGRPPDLTGQLRDYRPTARLIGLERLAGTSKKGVCRITLDNSANFIVTPGASRELLFSDREWMLDLAGYRLGRVLAGL